MPLIGSDQLENKMQGLPPGQYGSIDGYQPKALTNKMLARWRTANSAGNPACMVLAVKEIDSLRLCNKNLIQLLRLNQELLTAPKERQGEVAAKIEEIWEALPLTVREKINKMEQE